MKLSLLFVAAAGVIASSVPNVLTLTKEYFDQMFKIDSVDEAFLSNETMIIMESELPFGGLYGKNNISLFVKRMDLTFDTKEKKYKVMAVDEAKGTALVRSQCDVTFKRTGLDANIDLLHIIEWNQIDGTVLMHRLIHQNTEEVVEAYRTLAEKKLWSLLWAFFESDYDDVINPNSKFWSMVDDDIKLRLKISPEDVISESQTAFNGKKEVAYGLEEVLKFEMSSPHFLQDMYHDIANHEILWASDTEVFASFHAGEVVVHYTFQKGPTGKLIRQELLFTGALDPWDVYLFPMPAKLYQAMGLDVEGMGLDVEGMGLDVELDEEGAEDDAPESSMFMSSKW